MAIETNVGKGEIIDKRNVNLCPQCFYFFSEKVSTNPHLNLYHTISTFDDPEGEGFENTVGKGENAHK